jgi:hypothetical protein
MVIILLPNCWLLPIPVTSELKIKRLLVFTLETLGLGILVSLSLKVALPPLIHQLLFEFK